MKSKRSDNNARRFDARSFAGLYDYGYFGYDAVHRIDGEG